MFCACPNLLNQPKNLTAFNAYSKIFVPEQEPILLNSNHLVVWHKTFWTVTICQSILALHITIEPAQNTLGSIEGQGITEVLKISLTV